MAWILTKTNVYSSTNFTFGPIKKERAFCLGKSRTYPHDLSPSGKSHDRAIAVRRFEIDNIDLSWGPV